jgi:hypothetical protein
MKVAVASLSRFDGWKATSKSPLGRSLTEGFAILRDLLASILAPSLAITAAGMSSPVAHSVTQNRNPSRVRANAREVQRVCYLGFPPFDDLREGQGQVIPFPCLPHRFEVS